MALRPIAVKQSLNSTPCVRQRENINHIKHEAYEMGALTAFLCSSGAGYINGVDILADGGQNAGIFVPQI